MRNKVTSNKKVIYVTDIHGDKLFVEELFKNVKERKIKNVIIGGDIVGSIDVAEQIHEKLNGTNSSIEEYIKEFKIAHNALIKKLLLEIGLFKSENKVNFYLLPGNDDWFDLNILDVAERNKVIKNLHMRVHKIGDLLIAGCAFIPYTPFGTNFETEDKNLYDYLKKIAIDPKRTIYVIHTPPSKTEISVGAVGDLGSESVRNFIERYQPPLTLHGHIHESILITGKWITKIKNAISINPGRIGGKFTGVIFDLEKISEREFEYVNSNLPINRFIDLIY